MRAVAIVICVVVPLVALIFAYKKVRYAVSETMVRTSFEVLMALDEATELLTVAEIGEIIERNGGYIMASLGFLHQRELISSTHSMTSSEAADVSARFAISPKGRLTLIEAGKDI